MKKIWVQISSQDRYDGFKREWKLGTVVGVNELPYSDNSNLLSAITEPKLFERYLVQLDDGGIEEAWSWDTYEPIEVSTATSDSLETTEESPKERPRDTNLVSEGE